MTMELSFESETALMDEDGSERAIRSTAVFGAGGGEPYERALKAGHGALRLVASTDPADPRGSVLDVARFTSPADAADLDALDHTAGALLDVGCGPARIVHAAIRAGRLSLGIDLSRAAIAHAAARGLPVLRRSVFQSIPAMGSWDTVALFDGNIGIGGDPTRLLARCAHLVAPGGSILVETHADADRDVVYEAALLDSFGHRSAVFPWSETGSRALGRRARDLGLRVESSWTTNSRAFSLISHG